MSPPKDPSLKPRKEAKQQRAARTIDFILEATERIMERDESIELTTNDIAANAGLSIGSLYQYFPNKESIVVALVRRRIALILRRLDIILADQVAKSLESLVDALANYLVSEFSRHRRLRRYVMRTMMARGMFYNVYMVISELDAAVEQRLLAVAEQRGRQLTPAAAFVLARGMIGTMRAAMIEDSRFLGTEELYRELAGTLLRALRG